MGTAIIYGSEIGDSCSGPTGTMVDTDISMHSVSIGVISPLVTPVVCLNELFE